LKSRFLFFYVVLKEKQNKYIYIYIYIYIYNKYKNSFKKNKQILKEPCIFLNAKNEFKKQQKNINSQAISVLKKYQK